MLNLSQKLEDCITSAVYEQNCKTLCPQQLLNLFYIAFENKNVVILQKELQVLINDGVIAFTNPRLIDYIYLLEILKIFIDLEKSTTKWLILYNKIHSIFTTKTLLQTNEIVQKKDVSQIKLLKIFQWYEQNPDQIPDIALCTTAICKLKEFEIFKNLDTETYVLFLFSLFIVKNTPVPNIDKVGYQRLIDYFDTSNSTSDQLLDMVLDLYQNNYPDEVEIASENDLVIPNFPSSKLNVLLTESKRQQRKQLVHAFSRQYALQIKASHQKFIQDLSNLDNTLIYHQNDYILQSKDLFNVVRDLRDSELVDKLANLEVSWVFESRMHLINRLGSLSKDKLPNNFFHSLIILSGDEIIHLNYLTIIYQLGGDDRIYGTEVKLKELLGTKTVKIDQNKLESCFESEGEQTYLYNFLSRLEEETHKWQKKQ